MILPEVRSDVKADLERLALERRQDRWRCIARKLLCLIFCCLGAAQATTYVYDGGGRLVALSRDDGASSRYIHDVMGNIVSIDSAPADQLAIFAFSPSHGTVGSPVTIYGHGFRSVASSNEVRFNGALATVLAATASSLSVTVPDGATTGPLSVSVDDQTQVSAKRYVVDETGLPPVIHQIMPLVATPGDALAVVGNHLSPVPEKTIARLGTRKINLTSVSNSNLDAFIPPMSSSGRVAVQTPYGQAESADTIVILPTGVSKSSLVSRGVATVDKVSVDLSIPEAGKMGAVLFDSQGHHWISLQVNSIVTSASEIIYKVYAPGNVLISQGSVSRATPSIHLPELVGAGTYLVTFQPNSAQAQLTVAVESNVAMTADVSTNLASSTPGRSERAIFAVQSGQTLAFKIESATTVPANSSINYTIYLPSGKAFSSGTSSGEGIINLPRLPAAGDYQVIASLGVGVVGSVLVKIVNGTTGSLVPGSTTKNYKARTSGQNIYLSFMAEAGSNLELVFANAKVIGATNNGFLVDVRDEKGAQVASNWCYQSSPGGSCSFHLWYMAAGEYFVTVVPYHGGTLHFDVLLRPHLGGRVLEPNGTIGLALGAGQVEHLTFSANAGDTLALEISGVSTEPGGQPVRFVIYRPDVGAIRVSTPVYTETSPTTSQLLNLPNLPVSGTYRILAIPAFGLAGSAQLSLISGVTGTVVPDVPTATYEAKASGQNIYLNFTAQAGANLELVLANAKVLGATNSGFLVYVHNAIGVQVAHDWCYQTNPGNSCSFHLWYMAAGEYLVTLVPYHGGRIHCDVLLRPHLTGRVLEPDGAVGLTLGAGQVERLTFTANAGDTLALEVSAARTYPAGQPVRFIIYRPDVGAIRVNTAAYTEFSPTTSQLLNLPNLPESGTYTILAVPAFGLASDIQLSLISGTTGTVAVDEAMVTYAAKASGQNIYLNFRADAGANLELVFANAKVPGATNNGFMVYVHNAMGAQVAHDWCYQQNPGSSCSFHLWHMAAGNYFVTVVPYHGGVLHFDVLLRPHLFGRALLPNSTVSLALAAAQVERLTFTANAGDTLALEASDVSTLPAGQPMRFLIYRPDVGAIRVNTPTYTEFSPTTSQLINLPNLPVSGTYTILAIPAFGLAGSARLSLVSGVTGMVALDAPKATYDAKAFGQNVYLSFKAHARANLELVFANTKVVGATNNGFQVYVHNAMGAQVAHDWCYQSSPGGGCSFHLWHMAAGDYLVTLVPYHGGTLHFDVLLRQHLIGRVLERGDAVGLDLGAGQVERLTFNANAGDTVALEATGVITQPAGQALRIVIYRPDVGAIRVNTPAYTEFSPTTSQLLNLPDLPVSGTYTILAIPSLGLPARAKLTLVSGVTGMLKIDGEATSHTTNVAGQSVYLNFHADPNDDLELTLKDIRTEGSSNGAFLLNIHGPKGHIVNTVCYTASLGGSCLSHLWNLPTGRYSVEASAAWGGSIHFDALLTRNTVIPKLLRDMKTEVSLMAGQVKRSAFEGRLGENVSVKIADVRTKPSGGNVTIRIFRPDTGAVSVVGHYALTATPATGVLNLPSLPVAGIYLITIEADNGLPANALLTVSTTK